MQSVMETVAASAGSSRLTRLALTTAGLDCLLISRTNKFCIFRYGLRDDSPPMAASNVESAVPIVKDTGRIDDKGCK